MDIRVATFLRNLGGICLAVILSGCNLPETTLNTPINMPTLSITAPQTPTATLTTTPRLTSTPTPKPSNTPTEAPTAQPTLSRDQAETFTLELLQTNAGCRLPCWWGIMPGTTTWEMARDFLNTFATKPHVRGALHSPPFLVTYRFPTSDEVSSLGLPTTLSVEDDLVTRIVVSDYDWPAYRLAAFLQSYGPPSEIWLSTYSGHYNFILPFVIVLYYPEQGILASYSTEGNLQGDMVQGCFQGSSSLSLWSPSTKVGFVEAAQTFGWDVESVLYLPLAQASNFDVDTFYQSYKDAQDVVCVETPASVWPKP